MSKVAIVTDSAASIPEALRDSLEIHWVPYYIHRGEEVLRDLLTVQREAFYAWLPTARELPKTASPGPGDYVSIYQQLAAQGVREIVSIHMTSQGSGAYQAAMAARAMVLEDLPHLAIEVIDTLNVSMCQGWMAIEAARQALAGCSLAEIVAHLRAMIPVTHMIQTADTLKYLYMGGRIGRAKHLIGSILNIRPLIGMQQGEIVALGTARSRHRAYEMIAEMVERVAGAGRRLRIAYVHAAARPEAEKLRALVEQRIDAAETLIAELSPALGVHSGPGTVGVCFTPERI